MSADTDTRPAGVTTRRYGARGRGFKIDGVKAPGVTKILDMLPNEHLIGWAATTTAEYALDNWAELSAMPYSQRLKAMIGARYNVTRPATARGTEVHRLAEGLIAGEAVQVPEAIAGYVESYRQWLDEFDPEPIATELLVAHRTMRYCGFPDLIADLPALIARGERYPAARWLLELKTTGRRIYPETALQLAGYRHAEVFVAPNSETSEPEERPLEWLGIQYTGAVWIRSDSCELRPVDTGPEVWEFFTHLKELYDRQDDMQGWVDGAAAEPDLAARAAPAT